MANNPGALSQDDIDSLLESINSSESLSLDESLSNVISSPTGKNKKLRFMTLKGQINFQKSRSEQFQVFMRHLLGILQPHFLLF